MKDNETFIREIYEKAAMRQQEMEQSNKFVVTKKKWFVQGVCAMGMFALCVGIFAGVFSAGEKEQGQEATPSIANFSIEQGEDDQRAIDGKIRANTEAETVEIAAEVKTVTMDSGAIRGTVILVATKNIAQWKKGDELTATFDTNWLSFSLEEGKEYQLQLEQMPDGTYMITGGEINGF